MKLLGKVALVTGSSDNRSIGWAIAHELAKEGADIVVTDIPSRNTWIKDRVSDLEAMGRRAVGVAADVTQPDQIQALFEQAATSLGRIDIVGSNAGIIRWERFLDITPKNLRDVVNVNLVGNMHVCQVGARYLRDQQKGGRIIITSSVQADMHFPATAVYGGTKYAMHIFVGSLALELAPYQITVNHIGPGWVRSALNDPDPAQQSADGIEANRQSVPLKRDGKIEEMGRAAVYFASDDGAYTTGAFLRVDGGLGISKYSL